ncbi:hypothetical protein [Paracoccus mutanolyticus]|nr:hypothetical protein [Paracoccus mutanolyticus]
MVWIVSPGSTTMEVKMKARIEDRSMNNLIINLIRQAMEREDARA